MKKHILATIAIIVMSAAAFILATATRTDATHYTGADMCHNIDGVQSGHEWWLRDLNGDKRCQVFRKGEGWVFP